MLGGVWWNVCMDEKGYVGAYMFMVSVVEYVIGKVNVMVEYMLGGMHDIVVSVSIHVGGEDGLGVEGLGICGMVC